MLTPDLTSSLVTAHFDSFSVRLGFGSHLCPIAIRLLPIALQRGLQCAKSTDAT